MSQFVISDIEEATIEQLRLRAAAHGCTAETEAEEIQQQAVHDWRAAQWAKVNAIRDELAATDRTLTHRVGLIREGRDR